MTRHFSISQRRRGATLILVLALLAILALFAAVFSYTSQLEAEATQNFAATTQARMSAVSGLPTALAMLEPATSLTTTLQPWSFAPTYIRDARSGDNARRNGNRNRNNGRTTRRGTGQASRQFAAGAGGGSAAGPAFTWNQRPEGDGHSSSRDDSNDDEVVFDVPPQAVVGIADLSGRVNVNAISSKDAFERFVNAVFRERAGRGRTAAARTRSQALFDFRNTDPGTTETLQPDLREEAPAETFRVENLMDLVERRNGQGRDKLFTLDEMQVLAGFLTTFSQSPEVYNAADGRTIAKLPLDELLPEPVLERLAMAYPSADYRLLMQYAANIVDYADGDSVPTILRDPYNPEPMYLIIGVEKVPFITEVYPDSLTRGAGDEGEYVEIFNPWDTPVSLANWRLTVGGAPGFGTGSGAVTLSHTLPPGGYLVITDNYDQPSDDSPPESGSFLSVFGARKDDGLRQLLVVPGFDLPHQNSYVSLADANGNIIDIFGYGSAAETNGRTSYQRQDPRVRAWHVSEATPFQQLSASSGRGSENLAAMRLYWSRGNVVPSSAAELLRVPTSHLALRRSGEQRTFEMREWQAPELRYSEDAGLSNLDLRLVDLFTPVKRPVEEDEASTATAARPHRSSAAEWRDRTAAARREAAESRTSREDAASTEDDETSDGVVFAYGRINLNTCPKEVLLSVDGSHEGHEMITDALMNAFDKYREAKLENGEVPFTNPSEFIAAFYPGLSTEHLTAMGKVLNQITVSSSSFEIVAQNRPREQKESSEVQQKGFARMIWQVALDEKPVSVISVKSFP